jgi:hypothetical protein
VGFVNCIEYKLKVNFQSSIPPVGSSAKTHLNKFYRISVRVSTPSHIIILCLAASSIRPPGRSFCKTILLKPLITLYRRSNEELCRTQPPRDLRRGIAAARLQGLWVRIQKTAQKFVSCECCVLSGRGLWVGLFTRLEESYWVWRVWVWPWSLDNEEALARYNKDLAP